MTQTPFGARQGAFRQPVLDMTPDGRFRAPRRPSFALRLIFASAVVAVVAGSLAIMALALWVVMALIPIALIAGLVAYATLRFRRWRTGGTDGGPLFSREWGDGRVRRPQPGGFGQ